jgi:hypothetical protein
LRYQLFFSTLPTSSFIPSTPSPSNTSASSSSLSSSGSSSSPLGGASEQTKTVYTSTSVNPTTHLEEKMTLTRTQSSERIMIKSGSLKGKDKLGTVDFEVWREVWIQTMEYYKEQIAQSPLYEVKKNKKPPWPCGPDPSSTFCRILCKSICHAKGTNDPLSKTMLRIVDLYGNEKKKYTTIPLSSPPTTKKSYFGKIIF